MTLFAGCLLFACSKRDTAPKDVAIDYGMYKPKTSFHSQRNYTGSSSSYSADTTHYTYSGTSINYLRQHNGLSYDYRLTLDNGLYTQVLVTNNTVSPSKTYYRLNPAGYIDSSWITNTSGTTQKSWYLYTINGTKDIETSDYITYKNVKKYHYQHDIAVYSFNERISYTPAIAPAKDSVTYEYTTLPLRADYFNTGMPVSLYGKPEKYLLKKATYHNQLDNNTIRQTMEYNYQTNHIGLITQKIMNIYTHPGNILLLTDTTVYSYYNL